MSAKRSDTVRSPADILRLAVATSALLVLLLVETLFGGAVVGFAVDLLRGLDAINETFLTAIVALVRVTTVVVLLAGLGVAIGRGRWRVVGTLVAAAAAGAVVFAVAEQWINERGPKLTQVSDGAGWIAPDGFPTTMGVVIAAAALTSAAPWLSRRHRRAGWVLVLALTGARFVAAPVSGLAAAALLSGWVGGAVAVVLFGAPSRRPQRDAILTGLQSVGLDVATLEPASVDARGSTPYFGTASDGGGLFVKVLGRDQRDADLLFRAYRFLQPRDLGDERPFSSLRRAVEHEALVALTAARFGARTPAVAALCDAEPGGFVLAYEAVSGRSLDKVDSEAITDEVLARVWEQVALLRRHRLAHRDLRLANVFLSTEGDIWMIDFGFAELAASDLLLATDLAELTAALTLKVGPARAVAAAVSGVGRDALQTALPRLRPKYLSGATRTALKAAPGLLDQVRQEVSAGPTPAVAAPVAGGR